ncbi:MAG: CDP-glycerol glycerophosphotransferase family protein [Clostridium sp.]|nr:CDP-glycerol glycerophosphotransferase family protein [Clostridium sp.]
MKGKRYGDNPKYIADEILRKNLDYEIVWLIKSADYAEWPEGIRPVKYTPIHVAYHLATARIWIDSNTKPLGVLKRKGQYYIQTWHGSYGLKKMYGDIPDKMNLFDKRNIQYNSKIQDLFVSNSDFYSEIYRRAFWYSGEILKCGSPRNDIFFTENQQCLLRVQAFFKIKDKKIALYAPTYRNDFDTDAYHLDFERLRGNLAKRFGGDWVILVRLHPHNMIDAEKFLDYTDTIVNATTYSVMQELLVAADLLISDYSSCMFDFVTTKKPCFMYASDAQKYKEEHDFYFNIYELPFPLAQNNDEMEEKILQFDDDLYQKDLEDMFKKVGLCETGTACRQVVDWIEAHV